MEGDDDTAFQALLGEWRSLPPSTSPNPDWDLLLSEMQDEMRRLRAIGRWRTGGRTMLHALGIHDDEVRLCRALAWLLTPDGWHGLDSALLTRLLDRLELRLLSDEVAAAAVSLEEPRDGTRADIVVRAGSETVLFEAKIWAREGLQQADRLASIWAEDSPKLVFLTRDGRLPETARDSRGDWTGMSWSDIGNLLGEAIDVRPDCAPGARDLLATLQHYGG